MALELDYQIDARIDRVNVAGNGLGMDVLSSVKYAFASRQVHLQN
jgi:hypothetical protein